LLQRALRCALSQRHVDVQVIVIDEASTDATADVLSRLDDDRVVVVTHEQARGVSAARNAGIERADAPWVAFLDDDDVWSPDKLWAQLDAAADVPGALWACSGAVWVNDHLGLGRPDPAPEPGVVSGPLLTRNVIPGGASNAVADTDLVRSVGGFDTSLSNMADYDLWIRLGLQAPLGCVQRPLVGYYVHPRSMAHDVRRSKQELALIGARYARERESHGVRIDSDQFLWYFGAWSLRQGDRWAAARDHLRLALTGDAQRLDAAVGGLVGLAWPGVQLVRDRRSSRLMSPAWRAEAEAWLAPLREPEAWLAPLRDPEITATSDRWLPASTRKG
jgi:glycosyltransferase involved in cell wall biosynthesis